MITEFLFKYAEPAVNLSNVLLTLSLSLLVSLVMGLWMGKIRRSMKEGFTAAVIIELILVILFISVRDKVHKVRLNYISKSLSELPYPPSSSSCNLQGIHISNWREGINYIKRCPTELGFYIETADFLEIDRDYESAATLIEFGLDFLRLEPVPPILCERLRRYYQHLNNRAEIDQDCNKFHSL